MAQMEIYGPLVRLVHNAAEHINRLNADITRLVEERDALEAAIREGIIESVNQRGHELPEKWEAQPSPDGLRLIVSWSEDG